MRAEYYGCVAGKLTSLFTLTIIKLGEKLITQKGLNVLGETKFWDMRTDKVLLTMFCFLTKTFFCYLSFLTCVSFSLLLLLFYPRLHLRLSLGLKELSHCILSYFENSSLLR